jgi:hypothetical protein
VVTPSASKSKFDRLVKIGYQMETSDFVIVDERNEKELKEIDWDEAERSGMHPWMTS